MEEFRPSYQDLEMRIQELEQKHEFFKLIADNTFDWELFRDASGKVIYCNNAFEKITGYATSDHISGKVTEKDFVHPDDWNIFQLELEHEKLENSVSDFEFRIIKKDFSVRTVNLCSQPIYKNSEFIGIRTSIRDITDFNNFIESKVAKKKALESEEKYKMLFNVESDAIFILNKTDWSIVDANNSATLLYGYNRDELLNMYAIELSAEQEKTRQAANDTTGLIPIRYHRKKDGTVIPVEIIFSDFEYSGNFLRIAAVRDYTNRIEAQQELIKAKEKAEESDRLKTAFLHNMSHEIRTPMNAIMGFAELMKKNFNNISKLEKFSNIINQRCSDLLDIINDLLDIAKIESGQLQTHINVCDIHNLFNELWVIFTEYQMRMDKQHIKFNLYNNCPHIKYKVLTDSGKIKQILINLITNAFKYTNEGSVTGRLQIKDNKNLVFTITDTGIGISKDKQNVIFERFVQLNQNVNKNIGGNGLGLSIVKGLVDILDGDISLESNTGKGSTFTITIPFEKDSKLNEDLPITADNKYIYLSGKTILIVEDDQYNAAYMHEVLKETGLNIIIAETGSEAINKAWSQPISLILMDIRLPDMSGYEVTRYLKQLHPNLKIIAQTAYVENNEQQKALSSGFDGYISKPSKSEELIQIVIKHLAN